MSVRPILLRHLEALLFSAGESLPEDELYTCLREGLDAELTKAGVAEAISALREHYEGEDSTFQLQFTNGGWRLLTKPAYHATLSKYYKQRSGKRLSRSALETLSIVAYRQPVTKADIEAIRGVGSDYAVNKLLERELVAIVGRDPGPGRPLLYGTSPQFMDYFGLGDITDLPKLRELTPPENAIGELPALTESTPPDPSVPSTVVPASDR